MKKVGEETNAVKNSGYFPACNTVVMLKIEARPGCAKKKRLSLGAGKRIRTKEVTSKLEGGLNFTVNVDFLVLQR